MKARLLPWGVAVLALAPSLTRGDSLRRTVIGPELWKSLGTDHAKIPGAYFGKDYVCVGLALEPSDFLEEEFQLFFRSVDLHKRHLRARKAFERKEHGRASASCRSAGKDDYHFVAAGNIHGSICDLGANLEPDAPSGIGDNRSDDRVHEIDNENGSTYTADGNYVTPEPKSIGSLVADCQHVPFTPTPTPEPSTVLLLGTTLVTLIGAAKFKLIV